MWSEAYWVRKLPMVFSSAISGFRPALISAIAASAAVSAFKPSSICLTKLWTTLENSVWLTPSAA